MAITRAGITSAVIQKARVLDVDMATYTLTVATEFAKKPLSGLSFATPYQHFVNGEGIYFMPEVGSICWVCEPSDGGMAFVLAWGSGQDEGDFRARKMDLNPGDIYLGTRDSNFMILRRGGVVQIGGGGLCQRIFLPIDNTIRDFCENYGLYTLAGQLEWGIARQESTTDGHIPGQLVLTAREFADDAEPVATLRVGSHHAQSDDQTILSLSIEASWSSGASEQISVKMDKSGNIQFTVEGNVNWEIASDWSIHTQGNISQSADGNVSISAKGNATFSAKGSTTVEGDAGVTVKAPTTSVTGTLNVQGGVPVALAPQLLVWLASHVHPIIVAPAATPAPGNQTTLMTLPPSVPPDPSIASIATTSL